MLVEIIRELTKCNENTNIYSENCQTWAKRVEAQRAQTVVISSLHETKSSDEIVQKDVRHTDKDPQQTHSPCEEDVNTADKNTNWDDAWHMGRGVTSVTSSTILKMYAGVPGVMQSTPLKRKLYTNKSLALKW